MEFIKNYKFTIAFENSSVPGYTTEKLLEPIMMKSLPIYYGNPLVQHDFNVDLLVQVKGLTDIDRAIEEIIMLDKNDDIYLEKLKRSPFINKNAVQFWEETLLKFMNNIFNQPVCSAIRRPAYGFNRYYIENLKLQTELFEKKSRLNRVKTTLKTLLKTCKPE